MLSLMLMLKPRYVIDIWMTSSSYVDIFRTCYPHSFGYTTVANVFIWKSTLQISLVDAPELIQLWWRPKFGPLETGVYV